MTSLAPTSNEQFTAPGGQTIPITIPAGLFLQAVVLKPVNADTVSIGLTDGQTEIEDSRPLNANTNNTIIVQQKFDTQTILYLTGLTAQTAITVYKI